MRIAVAALAALSRQRTGLGIYLAASVESQITAIGRRSHTITLDNGDTLSASRQSSNGRRSMSARGADRIRPRSNASFRFTDMDILEVGA